MSIALYCDVHVRQAVTEGLRLREVDVLTAQEDGAAPMDDPVLLDRAMILGRVVFTQDEDFLREAHRHQKPAKLSPVLYTPINST
jgi:predicted nuclease of predicted toxin-antitoxin system